MATKKNWAFRHRGLIGGILLAPGVVLILLSKPMIAADSWFGLAVAVLAWVVFVSGLVFRIWPTLYVGGRKLHTLVDQGPYSICRNPLYLGSFLLAVSGGLFLQSLTFVGLIGLAVLAYALKTVPAEEKELHRVLGQPYITYCKRVPRFLPHLALFQTPEVIEVKTKGLRVEAKRALVWLWLPIIGQLVAHLRDQPWWPYFIQLP